MSVRGSNRPVRELATLVPACDHSVVLWLLWQTYTMGRHPAAQQRKVVNALRRKSTVCVWRGRMRETVGGALSVSSSRWLCPSQTVQYSCGIGLRLLEKKWPCAFISFHNNRMMVMEAVKSEQSQFTPKYVIPEEQLNGSNMVLQGVWMPGKCRSHEDL